MSYDYDRSYPSYEEQLRWRLEDLEARLEELNAGRVGFTDTSADCCRSKEDLAYTLPEELFHAYDVLAAMEMVREKLDRLTPKLKLRETMVMADSPHRRCAA